MQQRDNIFKRPLAQITPFEFNEEVANVFDDMVERSIPSYHEINNIIVDLFVYQYRNNMTVYDLGCSTGNTLLALWNQFRSSKIKLIGVDQSQAMIERSRRKLNSAHVLNYELLSEDINQLAMQPSDFTIMNYTLQFIPIEKRLPILKKIYASLNPNGLFVLTEKVTAKDKKLDQMLIDLYYNFKRRQGYSELEISQKREALENVLIPLTSKQNKELLQQAGFDAIETVFKWYNFTCIVGRKDATKH